MTSTNNKADGGEDFFMALITRIKEQAIGFVSSSISFPLAIFSAIFLAWLYPVFGRKLKKELNLEDEQEKKREQDEQENKMTPFQKLQKQKSTSKVKDIEDTNMPIIDKCMKLLGPMVAVGGFDSNTKASKMEGIIGVEAFEKKVENMGKQLDLHADLIEGIKLSANVRTETYQINDIKVGATNEKGSLLLYTGGYFIERKEEGDKLTFDFEIAVSVIKIDDIVFQKMPASAHEAVRVSWIPSLSSKAADYREGGSNPEDWQTYFQYKANKQLMNEIQFAY